MNEDFVVRYQVAGRVAQVTMSRPAARNAVNDEMARGIEESIDRIESDPEVWAAVLCGDGPVFSAGADLKLIADGRSDEFRTERGGFAGIVWRERSKPLIAAVDGPAIAGGFEIALACDLIVASTTAYFALPEVKRGLVAAAGGLFRLPRLLPPKLALELAITGRSLSARRAHELGLVGTLTAPGSALAGALELASEITSNAPVAVRETRSALARSYGESDEVAWELTSPRATAITRRRTRAKGRAPSSKSGSHGGRVGEASPLAYERPGSMTTTAVCDLPFDDTLAGPPF